MVFGDKLESWFEHAVVTVSSRRCVECGTPAAHGEVECPNCGGETTTVETTSYATDWY